MNQILSGLTILPLWKPRPGSRNQTLSLDSPGLLGHWTARPHFPEIEPPQADAKNDNSCSETGPVEEIIAPSGIPITAPNGGTKATTISFMSLKSTPATNQEPTQERGTGLQPGPMTKTLEQDNQVAKLRFLTNERTPGPGAILLPLDLSTHSPGPAFPNALMNPPWKILSLEVGCYIDQRTLRSKLIAIFE